MEVGSKLFIDNLFFSSEAEDDSAWWVKYFIPGGVATINIIILIYIVSFVSFIILVTMIAFLIITIVMLIFLTMAILIFKT